VKVLFYNLAALWNLLLFVAAFATLFGFIYRAFLRKLLRARRIAHFREKRLLQEASDRQDKSS
jgi:hypothetical protein